MQLRPCRDGFNTWHFYINGYEQLREHVTDVVDETFPGSSFNCIGDNVQGDAPLMNSECGNVWGFRTALATATSLGITGT